MNREDGHDTNLISREPNPSSELRRGIPRVTRVIAKRVEHVDHEEIVDCDLLFIESSHVVRIGGDVNYEILELMPPQAESNYPLA